MLSHAFGHRPVRMLVLSALLPYAASASGSGTEESKLSQIFDYRKGLEANPSSDWNSSISNLGAALVAESTNAGLHMAIAAVK